jgi:hypothetical protein
MTSGGNPAFFRLRRGHALRLGHADQWAGPLFFARSPDFLQKPEVWRQRAPASPRRAGAFYIAVFLYCQVASNTLLFLHVFMPHCTPLLPLLSA